MDRPDLRIVSLRHGRRRIGGWTRCARTCPRCPVAAAAIDARMQTPGICSRDSPDARCVGAAWACSIGGSTAASRTTSEAPRSVRTRSRNRSALLDHAILHALRADVLRPRAVAAIIDGALSALQSSTRARDLAQLRRERETLDRPDRLADEPRRWRAQGQTGITDAPAHPAGAQAERDHV